MDDKTLAFERGFEFLGVAFRGLPKVCLFPAVSAVYGNTEVTMVYLGKPLDGWRWASVKTWGRLGRFRHRRPLAVQRLRRLSASASSKHEKLFLFFKETLLFRTLRELEGEFKPPWKGEHRRRGAVNFYRLVVLFHTAEANRAKPVC